MAKQEKGRTGSNTDQADQEQQTVEAERRVEIHWMDYRRMRPFDLNFKWVRLAGSGRRG